MVSTEPRDVGVWASLVGSIQFTSIVRVASRWSNSRIILHRSQIAFLGKPRTLRFSCFVALKKKRCPFRFVERNKSRFNLDLWTTFLKTLLPNGNSNASTFEEKRWNNFCYGSENVLVEIETSFEVEQRKKKEIRNRLLVGKTPKRTREKNIVRRNQSY